MSLPLLEKMIPPPCSNPQPLKSISKVTEAKTLLATPAMQPDADMCDMPASACFLLIDWQH